MAQTQLKCDCSSSLINIGAKLNNRLTYVICIKIHNYSRIINLRMVHNLKEALDSNFLEL